MEKRYLEFIRYCVDEKTTQPKDIDKMDWTGLFHFCQEQAIAGVIFQKIETVSNSSSKGEEFKIPREVLLQWFALSEHIRQRNILLNNRCVELTEVLQKDGFQCCILKGQGNALMYPNPYSRTSGDIDIWVMPVPKVKDYRLGGKDTIKERRKLVTEYVRRRFPKTRIRYQHIDYPVFKDVNVEVHFIPIAKNNPIFNKRIQQWAEEERVKVDGEWLMAELPDGQGRIPMPTLEFNVIYQMSHLMHHFFDEGIGLRQMIDYYYVLKKFRDESLEFRDSAKSIELEETLKYLGLWKFAGAVMYVMREVFALESQCMIAPVNEKRGKIILSEILKGGNFGMYDADNIKANNRLRKNIQRIKRDFRMMRYFPSECLWEPVFRIYHFFWRMRYN